MSAHIFTLPTSNPTYYWATAVTAGILTTHKADYERWVAKLEKAGVPYCHGASKSHHQRHQEIAAWFDSQQPGASK